MIPTSLSESDFLKAYALLLVLSLLGGAISGAVLGGITGAICGVMGYSLSVIRQLSSIAGALAGMVVSYFIFRWVVLRFIVRKLSQPAVA